MPIESLVMADSQNTDHNDGFTGGRVRNVFNSLTAGSVGEGMYDSLIEAGWVANGGTKASWSLVLSNGVPWVQTIPSPLPTKVTIDDGISVVSIGFRQIHFYDPYRHTPNLGRPHIWISMGDTQDESFNNLEGQIVLSGGWVQVGSRWQQTNDPFNGWWHIDYEAPVVGFEWNGTTYGGTKQVSGVSSAVGFFGFIWPKWPRLADIPYAGGGGPANGGNIARSTQLMGWLDVGARVEAFAPHLCTFRMTASTAGIMPEFQVNHGFVNSPFTCIANQFQGWLFPEVDPLTLGGREHFMVSFPKINDQEGVTYAAVCAGRESFRKQLQWGSNLAKSCSAVNGGFQRIIGDIDDYPGVAPGVYPIKYRHPLTTPGDQPVYTTAYLGAPQDDASKAAADQARIVGYLWDTLVMQDTRKALDTRERIGDRVFQCVGRHIITSYDSEASLWVCYEEKA